MGTSGWSYKDWKGLYYPEKMKPVDSKYATISLRAYARKCIRWMQEGHTLWIFFNNDFFGYALENARTLIAMIQEME